MNRARLGLGAAALMLFAALLVISPAGLPDTRLFGYTAGEIDAWALDAQAVELARGPIFVLDMVFLVVLAGFFLTVLPGWTRWLALAYLGADLAENLLLRAYYDGLGAAAPLSGWASPLTMGKWTTIALILGVLALGAATRARGTR